MPGPKIRGIRPPATHVRIPGVIALTLSGPARGPVPPPPPRSMDTPNTTRPRLVPPAGIAGAAPVAPDERVAVLDVLRGFALWGVCIANLVPWLAGYSGLPEKAKQGLPTWPVDRVTDVLLNAFVHGRFIAIFSFLFGLGVSVQLLRAEMRGDDAGRLLARRMVAAFAIGMAHALLLWAGDIVHIYAALAVVLFVARRWPVRRLVAAGGALVLLYPIAWSAFVKLAPVFTDGALAPTAAIAAHRAVLEVQVPALIARPSYAAMLESNWLSHATMLRPWVSLGWIPPLAGLFLLGLAVGRAGLLGSVHGHARAWRTALGWSLAVGLLGYLPRLVIELTGVQARIPADILGMMRVLRAVGTPAMSLAYVCAIVLLFQRPAWQRRLRGLGAVGRMALTNYLLQSVVGVAIFYGVGFGLHGKVGPTALVALSVTTIAAQAAASRWWLARFRFGPAEWVWRSLTYGRPQPMRQRAEPGREVEAAAA
jgi:uncharacterized protein